MSRAPGRIARERRRALRYVYAVLLPLTVLVIATAPLLMGVFGSNYAHGGTTALRVLALGSLVAAANYVFDALIAVSLGGRGYLLINVVNSAVVLGGFAAALPLGLGWACAAWGCGQALALGVAIILTNRHAGPREEAIT